MNIPRILEKFKQIEKIGMKGLLSHWMTFNIDDLLRNGIKELENSPWTACWSGGEYFRWNFNDPKIKWKVFDIKLLPEEFINILQWKDGLYHFNFNNHETHFGTIFIYDNKLLVCNTYGGVQSIRINIFNKTEWLQTFVQEITSLIPSYFTFLNLFGIPYETLDVEFRKDKNINTTTGIMTDFNYTYIENPECWLYDIVIDNLYIDVEVPEDKLN